MKNMKTLKVLPLIFLLSFCQISCKWLKEIITPPPPPPSPQGIAIKVTDNTNAKKLLEGINVSITSANKNDAKTTSTDGTCRWEGLEIGNYIITVTSSDYRTQSKVVAVSVGKLSEQLFQLDALPMLEASPLVVNFNNTKKTETVYFKNRSTQGDINLSIEGFEKWLSVSETNLTIPAKQQKAVTFTADTKGIGFGGTSTKVILNYRLNGNGDNTDMTVYLNLTNPQAPSIETNNATGISQTSADITGVITNTGGSPVVQRGITWSEGSDPKPETDSKEVLSGGGIGSFTLTAKSLKEGKIYYARAFATNSSGTSLGNVVQFTTATTPTPPSVTIEPAKNITINSAALTGKVSNTGGSNVTEQGFCWNTTGNPKITDNKIQANQDASGNFSANITGLTQGLVYYVRAYAVNGLGTSNAGYSNVENFKTQVPITPAKLTTLAATNITDNSAKLQGNLIELGSSPIAQYGFCWSTTNVEPSIIDSKKVEKGVLISPEKFTHDLSGLTKGTNYYVKAYVTTQDGKTYYGDSKEVITSESGLVVYYPFNESTVDATGNGNNANSSVKFSSDRSGNTKNAVDLSSGFVTIGKKEVGGYCDDLTIAFWVKINASNFAGGQKILVGRYFSCPNEDEGDGFCIMSDSESKRLVFYIKQLYSKNSNSFPMMKESQITDDWHHLVCTKSGTKLRFFLDGDYYDSAISDYSCAFTDYLAGNLTRVGAKNALTRIGGLYSCNSNQANFNGLIDEFRIYNFPMTDIQVEELYKR